MKNISVPPWLPFLLALVGPSPALAGSSAVQVTVTATVIAEPCEINEGGPISVEFGNDLLTTEINGSNYSKLIDYRLNCGSASALKMKIGGVGVGDNGEYLEASGPEGLAIAIKNNGSVMPVNSWTPFTYTGPGSKPIISAVPVNLKGGKLTAGEFFATATMTVEYQ